MTPNQEVMTSRNSPSFYQKLTKVKNEANTSKDSSFVNEDSMQKSFNSSSNFYSSDEAVHDSNSRMKLFDSKALQPSLGSQHARVCKNIFPFNKTLSVNSNGMISYGKIDNDENLRNRRLTCNLSEPNIFQSLLLTQSKQFSNDVFSVRKKPDILNFSRSDRCEKNYNFSSCRNAKFNLNTRPATKDKIDFEMKKFPQTCVDSSVADDSFFFVQNRMPSPSVGVSFTNSNSIKNSQPSNRSGNHLHVLTYRAHPPESLNKSSAFSNRQTLLSNYFSIILRSIIGLLCIWFIIIFTIYMVFRGMSFYEGLSLVLARKFIFDLFLVVFISMPFSTLILMFIKQIINR